MASLRPLSREADESVILYHSCPGEQNLFSLNGMSVPSQIVQSDRIEKRPRGIVPEPRRSSATSPATGRPSGPGRRDVVKKQDVAGADRRRRRFASPETRRFPQSAPRRLNVTQVMPIHTEDSGKPRVRDPDGRTERPGRIPPPRGSAGSPRLPAQDGYGRSMSRGRGATMVPTIVSAARIARISSGWRAARSPVTKTPPGRPPRPGSPGDGG
jgi:hypothetical protein